MIGKIVGSIVSLILVAGVIIGAAAIFNRHANPDTTIASPTVKAVSSMCAPTDYKEACASSLQAVGLNSSATPKDFIKAAVDATIQEMRNAHQMTGDLVDAATKDSREHMAMEDCKDLLNYAIDELQASYSTVGDNDLHTLPDRADELKNWLSAVISYQQACLDGLNDPQFQKAMHNGLLNSTQLTSNALAIVSELSDILGAFGTKIPDLLKQAQSKLASNSGRRLLGHTEVGSDGFPTWFSASDRKLMAAGVPAGPKPNAVVALDGSGQYKSIMAALAAYPKGFVGRYVIYVKAGIYNEAVIVEKDKVNVLMYGDGPRRTIVTGRKSFRDGISTLNTASFAALGNGFIARSMGFTNTAGPDGHQAVALRVQSDMSAFINCRIDAYQDSLYAQTHRQFYRNCVIAGTVDFIFGDSTAVIQNSLIIVRRPMDNQKNAVTAQGRTDRRETTGIVIHNCRIVPEQRLFPDRFTIPTYLGRPWKEFSRTVIMETTLADFIQPAGFLAWQGTFALDTLYYAEYANRGPGANTDRRVRWKGYRVIDRAEATQFTAGPFLQGNLWLKDVGTPYLLGFTV